MGGSINYVFKLQGGWFALILHLAAFAKATSFAPQQYKQSLIAFGLSSVAKATSFAPQQYKQSLIAFGLSSVQSVTMPAFTSVAIRDCSPRCDRFAKKQNYKCLATPSSARQSAKNKLQNRFNLINRTTLM